MGNSEKIALRPKLISMLKTIHDSIEGRVRVDEINSIPFKILIGLLQGDPNSPILFDINFAVIIVICNNRLENIGIKLRQN